jgi:hypothetical protein
MPGKGHAVRATGLLLSAVLLAGAITADASSESTTGYRPVTPPSTLHPALEANLKLARAWLDDGDFKSATQTAEGLMGLAWLYARQGEGTVWRQKTTALREACAALAATARKKDAAGAEKAARTCGSLLAALGKGPPMPTAGSDPDFHPPGSTKNWMLLMEGAYSDGKTSRAPAERTRYALEIAEEANVISYLRSAPRWRKMAGEVRAAALKAAETARKDDPEAARKAFRAIYRRCEACHAAER